MAKIRVLFYKSEVISNNGVDTQRFDFRGRKLRQITFVVDNSGWELDFEGYLNEIVLPLEGSIFSEEIVDSFTLEVLRDEDFFELTQDLEWKITNNSGGNSQYRVFIDEVI